MASELILELNRPSPVLIRVTLSGCWQGKLFSRGHWTRRNPDDCRGMKTGLYSVHCYGWGWDDEPEDWFEVGHVQRAGRLPDTVGPEVLY